MAGVGLPDQPEKPLPSDCCNSGCTPCILDVYEDLMKEWEEKCKRLKCGESVKESSEYPLLLFQTKYAPFQVVCIQKVTNDTNLYRFQAVKNVFDSSGQEVVSELRCILNLKPSQYLILRGNDVASGMNEIVTRAYTPVSDVSLSLKGCFDTVIKLYPDGKMSQYLKSLSPGDVAYWRGPYGGFEYKPNDHKHVLMLCAGTGIAPLYSLAHSIVSNEDDETTIRMLFCCRDEANIILRKEIHALQSFWNFTAQIYVPHNISSDMRPLYGETLKTGRLSKDVIASELNSRVCRETMVFICGSHLFCEEMKKWVQECGINSERIHTF